MAVQDTLLETTKALLINPKYNLARQDAQQQMNATDNQGNSPLHLAAQNSNQKITQLLLDEGGDIEVKNNDNKHPLHMAAQKGNLEVVKILLKKKEASIASNPAFIKLSPEAKHKLLLNYIDAPDQQQKTPLHLAAQGGHFNIVNYLENKNCKRNIEDKDEKKWGLIHFAAHHGNVDYVKYLIDKKIAPSPDVQDSNKHTPLFLAAEAEHFDVVDYLLSQKATIDISMKNKDGQMLIHFATRAKNLAFIKKLLTKKTLVSPRDEQGFSPATIAAQEGDLATLRYLLGTITNNNERERERERALFLASKQGHRAIIKYLLKEKTNPNTIDEKGRTPLYFALGENKEAAISILRKNKARLKSPSIDINNLLFQAIKDQYPRIIKKILQKKSIDPGFANKKNETALHLAAMTNNINVILALLANENFDINAKDKKGRTPLILAIEKKRFEVARFFIENTQAKLSTRKKNGENILHIAAKSDNSKFLDYLLTKKQVIKLINKIDKQKRSPLHAAVKPNNLDIFKKLLNKNAKINAEDTNGQTMLHYAAKTGAIAIFEYLLDEHKSTFSDIDDADNNGHRPLYFAAKNNHLEVFYSAVLKKALVTTQTEKKEHLLHWAIANNNDVITDLLINLISKENPKLFKEKDQGGKTVLHWAALNKNKKLIETLVKDFSLDPEVEDNKGRTPLHMATEAGSLDVAQYLVNNLKVNAHPRDNNGLTPMKIASIRGHNDIALWLAKNPPPSKELISRDTKNTFFLALENGNEKLVRSLLALPLHEQLITMKNQDNQTALHIAAASGNLNLVKFCAAFLFKKNQLDKNITDYKTQTPLHLACKNGHLAIVRYLIDELKVRLNPQDTVGNTPLHLAVRNNHLDVVRFLTEEKGTTKKEPGYLSWTYWMGTERVYITKTNNKGQTALHLAAQTNNIKIAELLLSFGLKVTTKDDYNQSPYDIALNSKNPKLISLFFSKKFPEKDSITILIKAASDGDLKTISYLLENKSININEQNQQKQTALHVALDAYDENTKNYKDRAKIIDLLIDNKPDATLQDNLGRTVAHIALEKKLLTMLKRLLTDKKILTTEDNKGQTLLHIAAKNGDQEALKYLIETEKVPVDISNKNKQTPVFLAAENGKLDTLKYLELKNAELFAIDKNNLTPLALATRNKHKHVSVYLKKIIEDKNKNIHKNIKERDFSSRLLTYAKNGELLAIQNLIQENKAQDIDFSNNARQTPLLIAIKNSEQDPERYLKIVEYLIDQGANVNHQDMLGRTSLHTAITLGNNDMVKLLLKKKANPNLFDTNKQTSIHWAAKKGRIDILKHLVKNGGDINAKDKNKHTPLLIAIKNKRKEIVQYLVTKKQGLHKALQEAILKKVKQTPKAKPKVTTKVETPSVQKALSIFQGTLVNIGQILIHRV